MGQAKKIIPYPANSNIQTGMPSLSNTLSPDGHWLAYYTGSAGNCMGNGGENSTDLALNLLNLADGKSRFVTSLLSHDYPDNFVRAARQLNRPNTSPERLQNAFVCGIMQSIAWSPDSQWILNWSSYGSGEGMTYDLYATSLDGTTINKLPVSRCDTSMWLDDRTCFSSEDGNGIGMHALSLLNIKTGDLVPVWSGEFSSLAISADHQWLAYFSHFLSQAIKTGSDPDFNPGLYLVNLDTLKASRVELPGILDDYQSLQGLGSGDQSFGLLNTAGNALYFLSPGGKLSSTGIQATQFSLSPDRQSLVAIGQRIHILKTDGTSVREVDLPAGLLSRDIENIFWRPDSSGLFFTYMDPQTAYVQLYVMDVMVGEPDLVENILIMGVPADFVWVGMPR